MRPHNLLRSAPAPPPATSPSNPESPHPPPACSGDSARLRSRRSRSCISASTAASVTGAASARSTPPAGYRRLPRTSGAASRKIFTSASGNTAVPMSRPSITTPPASPKRPLLRHHPRPQPRMHRDPRRRRRHIRIPNPPRHIHAHPAARGCPPAAAPAQSSSTPHSSSSGASSSKSRSFSIAFNASARYIAPVSRFRNPNRRARCAASVLFPAPAAHRSQSPAARALHSTLDSPSSSRLRLRRREPASPRFRSAAPAGCGTASPRPRTWQTVPAGFDPALRKRLLACEATGLPETDLPRSGPLAREPPDAVLGRIPTRTGRFRTVRNRTRFPAPRLVEPRGASNFRNDLPSEPPHAPPAPRSRRERGARPASTRQDPPLAPALPCGRARIDPGRALPPAAPLGSLANSRRGDRTLRPHSRRANGRPSRLAQNAASPQRFAPRPSARFRSKPACRRTRRSATNPRLAPAARGRHPPPRPPTPCCKLPRAGRSAPHRAATPARRNARAHRPAPALARRLARTAACRKAGRLAQTRPLERCRPLARRPGLRSRRRCPPGLIRRACVKARLPPPPDGFFRKAAALGFARTLASPQALRIPRPDLLPASPQTS